MISINVNKVKYVEFDELWENNKDQYITIKYEGRNKPTLIKISTEADYNCLSELFLHMYMLNCIEG